MIQRGLSLAIFSIALMLVAVPGAMAEPGSMDVLEYNVSYDIEGAEIVDMYLDPDFVEIIIDVVAIEDGILEIDIPRGLLDSKIDTEDDIFYVIIDGFETEYVESETSSDSRTLTIPFFEGDEQFEIIGTTALLEVEEEVMEDEIAVPEIEIPSWVKQNAGWWAEGAIDDASFVSGIQYLITNGIMNIPETESGESTGDSIPSWVKQNAGWWADGQIDDATFVSGIQYLITQGIITI